MSNLSPTSHITEIVAKAHQRANIILRCFTSGDINVLVRAFIVYVRPIVEHNSVIWSPSLKHYIDLIEQEAQLMLTTGSTRLAVSRGQQTWYHSTCYI